jgi:Holliday junction resolvase-like predicted endonuclease
VIAEAAGELVFVEVKTGRGTALGAPEEAITPR